MRNKYYETIAILSIILFFGSYLTYLWSDSANESDVIDLIDASGQNDGPFFESFNYPRGLITNEHAYWNPQDKRAIKSKLWEMTSGSLFAENGHGWTGNLDDSKPNFDSSRGTNSVIFRLTTRRDDFKDVNVSFYLLNNGLSSTTKTPQNDIDGVHISLRYQDEYHLYYVSVNRRDDMVVVKKKIPGGPSNGGTYYVIGDYARYNVKYDSWQKFDATIRTLEDNSVEIRLYADGDLILRSIDNGRFGQPIRSAGKIGIRGDNADFEIEDFTATSLNESA